MAYNVRDIAEWYPFIPTAGAVPDVVYHVLDMRIRLEIPASDDIYKLALAGDEGISRIVLTSISGNVAEVRCEGELFEDGELEISVPVLIGRDASGIPSSSYMIVDSNVSFTGELRIHPECLVIFQETPKLQLYNRMDVDTEETQSGWELAGELVEVDLVDGFNVVVSADSEGLLWTGGAGIGEGVWVVPPYSDWSSYQPFCGTGLRGINGLLEPVITCGNTLEVVSELNSDNDVVITITPRV